MAVDPAGENMGETTQELPVLDDFTEPTEQRVSRPRPKRRKHYDDISVGYHLLQLISGVCFLLVLVIGLQIVYMYWANSFDQIHIQETVAAKTAKKLIPSVDLTSEKIAKPRTGTPPVEGEPTNEQVIGWMYIPGIEAGWKRAIQEGTGLDVLDNGGLGHYVNTAMPGAEGNSAYAGHRTPGDLGFVDRLKTGDAIVIQTAEHWYVYKVTSSWVTTPDDAGVLSAGQSGRWLTLTTCHPMFTTVEASLQHRYIVRASFSYWANVSDGIPQELYTGSKAAPAKYVTTKAKQTVREISKNAPVTPIFALFLLVIWLVFNGACWAFWHADREWKPVSWNPFTLIWRIQYGSLPLRVCNYVFFWMMIAFMVWAWVSPFISTYMPWLNGAPTLSGNPTIGN